MKVDYPGKAGPQLHGGATVFVQWRATRKLQSRISQRLTSARSIPSTRFFRPWQPTPDPKRTKRLSEGPLSQAEVYRMVRGRPKMRA